MRRIILALLAFPAQAQDAAYWGGTGCRLAPVEGQPHVAEVICQNRLTGVPDYTASELTAGGLTVDLVINHFPGAKPDRFSVIVPEGFQAVPPEVDIPEHGGATILVYEWVGA